MPPKGQGFGRGYLMSSGSAASAGDLGHACTLMRITGGFLFLPHHPSPRDGDPPQGGWTQPPSLSPLWSTQGWGDFWCPPQPHAPHPTEPTLGKEGSGRLRPSSLWRVPIRREGQATRGACVVRPIVLLSVTQPLQKQPGRMILSNCSDID